MSRMHDMCDLEDQEVLAYVGRLRDARLAETDGNLEPMGAIFEEGKDIAWEACIRGWITFQLEVTHLGLAALEHREQTA